MSVFRTKRLGLLKSQWLSCFIQLHKILPFHLKNIFEEGELEEDATCKDFLQVQKEGNREVKRKQKFYNLDAIISVGYRIKPHLAKTCQRVCLSERTRHCKIDS